MALAKKNLILSVFILTCLVAIILSPQKYILVSSYAIEIWAKILLPSLLPFFIFTKLLTSLGYVKKVSNSFKNITYRLYKCPPITSYVFLMSILTGYPVGSKLVADLYMNGSLKKSDAKKCITFTSNSGPMFILGSVGIGMLASKTCGYIIYISHITGALINGIIYRNLKSKNEEKINYFKPQNEENISLSNGVMDSIFSILMIGGVVVIAFIIIEIFVNLNLFYPFVWIFEKIGINQEISNAVIGGFFEITKGCLLSSKLNLSVYVKTIITCGVISFGGVSTTLQAMAFLKDICGYKFFILQKITHMIFSVIICAILGLLVF